MDYKGHTLRIGVLGVSKGSGGVAGRARTGGCCRVQAQMSALQEQLEGIVTSTGAALREAAGAGVGALEGVQALHTSFAKAAQQARPPLAPNSERRIPEGLVHAVEAE